MFIPTLLQTRADPSRRTSDTRGAHSCCWITAGLCGSRGPRVTQKNVTASWTPPFISIYITYITAAGGPDVVTTQLFWNNMKQNVCRGLFQFWRRYFYVLERSHRIKRCSKQNPQFRRIHLDAETKAATQKSAAPIEGGESVNCSRLFSDFTIHGEKREKAELTMMVGRCSEMF